MIPIELLSPAKDKECALEALRHGADAVYMGATRFGARAAAENSLQDIETVARYAHLYGAKVYITLNTLLTPAEALEAAALSHDLQHAGVDALIVQDPQLMALRRQGILAPLTLHASTQMDNRTPEQVYYLEKAGYGQVVLARELNPDQIARIRQATTVPLEVFVHGALCVSYSGRCQLSEAACGRSANRGECAQYCRLPYNLEDADGKVLLRGQHLLSLKDMDRSASLQTLIEAGVSSFKIEGRLKDVGYVKNVTAYYRQKIDQVLDRMAGAPCKASYGTCRYTFTPDPQQTFHRSGTPYFPAADNRFAVAVHQWETPKSTGEYIGTLRRLVSGGFEVDTTATLHNGDGLCFVNSRGQFEGLRLNSAKGNRVYPARWSRGTDTARLREGMALWRNANAAFDKQLQGVTARRTLAVDVHVTARAQAVFTDQRGVSVTVALCPDGPRVPAKNQVQLREALLVNLGKLGDTPFQLRQLTFDKDFDTFVPVSLMAAARRQAVEVLEKTPFPAPEPITNDQKEPTPEEALPSPPTTPPAYPADLRAPLMVCKYCLRHALGYCPKGPQTAAKDSLSPAPKNIPPFKEPLYLVTGEHRFRLQFDCVRCQMLVLFP